MTVSSRAISRVATASAAVASAVAYPFLPSHVASHFDEEGRADRFSSRTAAAVLFPAMMLAMQIVNERLGTWPGGRDRDDRDSGVRVRDDAVAMVELGFLPAHLAILANGAGLHVPMKAINRTIYGVLMVALGNLLPKLPRNGLVGIRTPWTLADPGVWERTHRVGGYLVTAAGLASLASVPATGRRAARLPTVATLGAVAVSAAYSYLTYTRRPRPGHS